MSSPPLLPLSIKMDVVEMEVKREVVCEVRLEKNM